MRLVVNGLGLYYNSTVSVSFIKNKHIFLEARLCRGGLVTHPVFTFELLKQRHELLVVKQSKQPSTTTLLLKIHVTIIVMYTLIFLFQ